MASQPSQTTQDTGETEIRLEVRQAGRSTAYDVGEAGFLIGTVTGCDLRLPSIDLPPVLCLLTRQGKGVTLRKLAPTHPVLLNGKPTTHTALLHGDKVILGNVELVVHISPPLAVSRPLSAGSDSSPDLKAQITKFRAEVVRFQEERRAFAEEEKNRRHELEAKTAELDSRERKLHEQTTDLEADRVLWYQRRAEIDQEITQAKRSASRSMDSAELTRLAQHDPALAERARDIAGREADLERQRQELGKMRQELADIRRQLYDRYQERRDRLAGLQQAVNRAAQKVQEQKRRLETDAHEAAARRQMDAARQADLEKRATEIAELVRKFDQDRKAFAVVKQQVHELETRNTAAQVALEKKIKQHEADVLRLDRLQGALDEREQQLNTREEDLKRRLQELDHDSRDLEEQATHLDEWQKKLTTEAADLKKAQAEHAAAAVQLAQKTGSLEGQQATLAALRTRLERMREEVRTEEQQLAEQRLRQEEREAQIERLLQEALQRRTELEAEDRAREEERRQLTERGAVLDAAVAQLRQAQEKLAADEERLRLREAALENQAALQAEEAALVQAQLAQLEEAQKRIEAERHALQERTQALAQTEQARASLQEQLRRRGDELAARQKAVAEQAKQFESLRAELEQTKQQVEGELRTQREQLHAQIAEAEQRQRQLASREEEAEADVKKLRETTQRLAAERDKLTQDREALAAEKLKADQERLRAQADFEAIRTQAAELLQRLPDVELRAGGTLERLTHARDQLKEQLAQVHAYAQECQEDLETIRGDIQGDAIRVQEREQALRKSEDEHRLAVAAFRQQLIDWQGQVADMKRALATDETLLERKQAHVEKQAQRIGVTTERLAKQAEVLQEQEQAVLGRRIEVDRHLADMRQWYRQKLRELAGEGSQKAEGSALTTEYSVLSTDASTTAADSLPAILPLSDDTDRKLGALLQSLDLVDAGTLDSLLGEARRRRCSLRQVLLSGGTVTLYQMALIEAGQVDSLMLGPVRVIDRLRSTPHEAMYRVFDPRLGHEAVLRHLSEGAAAEHGDEFRRRFAHARLAHPHIAETYEVLDIAGRPAVLQELVTGLSAADWPPLAAVAGVCFRLLTQAGLGLAALHQAGRSHGDLRDSDLVLSADGILKICNAGERGTQSAERGAQDDLIALGRIAVGWCSPASVRRGAKTKPFPATFLAVVERLACEADGFQTAGELLEELDRISADVPANAEAWDRLLRHVRDHSGIRLRQSA